MRTTQLYQLFRRILAVGCLGGLLGLLPGCGPALSPEELGTVVFEPPQFDDDKPYPLPRLGELPADDPEQTHDRDHDR